MTRDQWLLVSCVLALTTTTTRAQPEYSSQPQPYDIPPNRIIHEYQRQIEEDINAVEHKAEALAHQECIAGQETFLFCSQDLNLLDFLYCLVDPSSTQSSDAFFRGIKFPSGAFGSSPAVAVGLSGIGSVAFVDIRVESKDVYSSGFSIVITSGSPYYPYSLTVQWIACPVKQPYERSVRDFTPKYVHPPPPYFPSATRAPSDGQYPPPYSQAPDNGISYKSGPTYNQSPDLYEESSRPVDRAPVGYPRPPVPAESYQEPYQEPTTPEPYPTQRVTPGQYPPRKNTPRY